MGDSVTTNLVTINVTAQAPLKLNSHNYLSWRLQFQTLFIGYDLQGYIDGTKPCPPQQLTATTNNITLEHLNPEYLIWIRQDQLILNAIIGSITPTIIPFIARANTSREAWNILAATYATPSRGRIKQVKSQLRLLTKGTLSITDFLQSVKAKADELAVLGAPIDNEDLTDKILEDLGDEYRELVRAVQARENAISFDELHEKLLMFEASLQATPKTVTLFPPTAHQASRTSGRSPFHNVNRNQPNNFSHGGNWRSYPQPSHSGSHGKKMSFLQTCSSYHQSK
ncbi:hypothetical protein POTOM_010105 [Populus tomentosa]|uniref:Retrotransposon Copia-like N-terminal domain-containing protein n=1 Tax=Populus tomentosa TaxID=118781 RepID=A0A8X8AHA4_POPTO|nr:hypothetical protein POTOM_010105 [Populus tomentosa]